MRTKWLGTMVVGCCILLATGWGGTKAADVNESNAIAVGEQSPPAEKPMQGMGRLDPGPEQMELQKHEGKPFDKAHGKWQPQQGQMPPMPGPGAQPPIGCDTPFGGPGPEMLRERMQEKADEYMKCLKENYPDEAAKLEQLKKGNPEQYMRALMISGKKYGRICQAVKDDPNLAKILKEQMALKEKRAELLKQIKTTTDEKQKKELTAGLEQVVGQQFDLIVKRKQLAYENLASKLAELQKEVDQRKAEVEKWKGADFKKQQVKQHVNELVSETEKFEWE